MFNNRFNSSKNDPLLEAVKAARADGDARRLAESMTNDLFGVFSRKAVVREYLSDYDYALEEAYKCMSMKEEDKMAAKDYDRDGKIETSKKEVWGSRLRAAKASGKYKGPVDEGNVSLKDVRDADAAQNPSGLAAQRNKSEDDALERAGKGLARDIKEKKMWEGSPLDPKDSDVTAASKTISKGSYEDPSTPKVPYSQLPKPGNRAGSVIDSAKGAAGMNEAHLDELTKPTAKTAMNAYYRAYDSDVRDGGEGKRTARLGRWKEKHLPGKSTRNQKNTGKAELDDYDRKTVKKSGVLTKASQKDTKGEIKSRLGKHTAPHLPEEAMNEEKWIQAALSKKTKGALHKDLNVSQKKKIPLSKLKAASDDPGKTGKRARLAMTLRKLHEKLESDSFKAAQETGKSVNEVAMGVPPAITPPAISRPARSTSGMKAPTGSFRGLGAQPMRTSSTQVNFNGVKPSAGYDVASRMSAAGRDAASSRASSLGGMNAADRIGGAIKSATSGSSAKGMVDAGRAAISRGAGAIGAGARIARGALGGPTGAAITAATIAAPYVASKMAASHKAGSTATPGVSAHQQTPDVKASDSFARMRGMSQTSTASSTPAATAASKPAIDPTAKGAKYAGGTVHNVTTLKQTAPGDQAQIQSVKTEKGWADPGRWENEVRSKTGAMQQIRTDPKRHVVDTATQQVGKQSASDEKSTSNFLQSQGVGTSSQSQDTPATPDTTKASVNINKKAVQENDEKSKAPKPMMTTFSPAAPMGNLPKMSDHPPSSLKEEVTVGNNKYRIV